MPGETAVPGKRTPRPKAPEPERTEVSDALGVSEAVLEANDPVGLVGALTKAMFRSAIRPSSVARIASYPAAVANAGFTAVSKALGASSGTPAGASSATRAGASSATPAGVTSAVSGGVARTPDLKPDKRFADPAWTKNPAFGFLKELYALNRQTLLDMVESAGLDDVQQAKAEFAARLLADATSPTNFLLSNPKALQKAFQTGGMSVLRGLKNAADDIVHNGGWPSKVDTSSFELGRNMAASPGKVVFRNDLIELIQYVPTTPEVHEIPLLCSPPWINKYYIMDLAPGKSLIEWAVSHGFTTFAISYRNPDSSMAGVGFEDYMLNGPRVALDVITEITGSPTVNTLSVCLGGTLTTCLLAYLDATGEKGLVNSSTLLNSLTDHEGAGTLSEVFTDEATVKQLEKSMASSGYLDAADMARTFDLLRANDLVFAYVESGWLMGESPPAFDLLAWNEDSTNMPAKMHSFYLRHCWLDNELAKDELELAGERLMTSKIDVDTYIVAAVDDHIVPWRSSYKTTQLLASDCRFVLSSSGHIAGIVNPPSPKTKLWTRQDLPASPDEWRAGATEANETWWNDWITWITARSGELGTPPKLGSILHPAIGDAPGRYVQR